jgi:hypothetical protein
MMQYRRNRKTFDENQPATRLSRAGISLCEQSS